jgi:DNA-binding MarR family transcriptional regulator
MLQQTDRRGDPSVTDHLVDTAASPVELLTVAQRLAARGLAAALAQDGTAVEQWRVLRALGDGEGHLMGELAGTLLIAQPTLTRLVDGLVDHALVYRQRSVLDRRRVAVHLSRQGRVRLARLDAIVAAHQRALRSSPEWARVQEALRGLLDGPPG